MAAARNVQLSLDHCGGFHVPGIGKESAVAASAVIKESYKTFHIFFNHMRRHNMLIQPVDEKIIQNLHEQDVFFKHLGQDRYYRDYISFFQNENDKHGHKNVVNESVLKGDGRANAHLIRMYAGLVHPFIELGFGIEFNRPRIIAEGFAEMCANDDCLGPYLRATEKAAASNPQPSKALADLIDEISADLDLLNGAIWEEGNGARHGILGRAPEAMILYASQWKVGVDELEYKMDEMASNAGMHLLQSSPPLTA